MSTRVVKHLAKSSEQKGHVLKMSSTYWEKQYNCRVQETEYRHKQMIKSISSVYQEIYNEESASIDAAIETLKNRDIAKVQAKYRVLLGE